MLFVCFLSATILLVIFTLLPLWRFEAWWVRSLDFPRLQLLIMAAAMLGLTGILLDGSQPGTWGLLVVTTFCLVYQLWWILPYTRLFPVEVKRSSRTNRRHHIRIITANVLMPNRKADMLIQLVRRHQPDILVTLESDEWWQKQLDALAADYPHTMKCPQDNLYGMHVYSKLPLTDPHIEYLVEPDIPSMHAQARLPSGQSIRVHFLHPAPPSPTENEASSERDAELIIVARNVAETDGPVIVTGDLNDVAWSATTRLFRKISGLLDPRVGRGMFNTFHADYWFIRWPLDHLFHSHHFTLAGICRLGRYGSDHFAIMTDLVFEPGRADRQNGLDPEADDEAWATSKARAEGVSEEDVPQPGD